MDFENLYDITFPLSEDRAPLYIQGTYRNRDAGGIYVDKGECIDLGTYFNAFSFKKWSKLCSIEKLKVKLNLTGSFYVEVYGMSTKCAEKAFLRTTCEDGFEKIFDIKELEFNFEFDLIGIKLVALSDDAVFNGGGYLGKFLSEYEIRIGITICTFKREKYLLPNLERLKTLTDRNPNYNVMVIDNGQTLEEVRTESLQIIHNPNFGGSGGFARGMLEQVSQNKNTHAILMDDDIVIELSALDRLYSVMRHLKAEHKDKFFGGAMLRLNTPTIQHENTAHWFKTWLFPFGAEFDLTFKNILCENEQRPDMLNTYNAWWFCCIPVDRMRTLGYPLPIFIKADDIEYSLRNNQDVLTMNGVGVWHEAFEKKVNPVTEYFADRNNFLLTHFALGCGRMDFLKMSFQRIINSIRYRDGSRLRTLELALRDLNTGLKGITSVKSDEKFASIRKYPLKGAERKSIYSVIPSTIILALTHFLRYSHYDKEAKKFREEKLTSQKFWREFLGIGDEV